MSFSHVGKDIWVEVQRVEVYDDRDPIGSDVFHVFFRLDGLLTTLWDFGIKLVINDLYLWL